jgi:CheY-like chemotaxis protein
MTSTQQELIAALPYARRFARALTGSQGEGDGLVGRAISRMPEDLPPRLGFYAAISQLMRDSGADADGGGLSPMQRQLLLLTALEEVPLADAARVLGLTAEEAAEEVRRARHDLRQVAATDILIIEDEPVIAMDLQMLVQGCGHRVAGVAMTEREAVRIAAERPVGLILADVNLGRGGSGITAVQAIMRSVSTPVIFVTAYPELLLTAEGVEPAFIVRKPFDPLSLAISTYQAVHAGRVPMG